MISVNLKAVKEEKTILNLLHLKYALEVGKNLSISRAAEKLFMSQPNLSRAIKELEDSLGIAIFNRTSRGIYPTEEGIEFLNYAESILKQIADVEDIYKKKDNNAINFSISVPRASYITSVFTEFLKGLDTTKKLEIYFNETNSTSAIDNILDNNYRMGIIRYQTNYEKYYNNVLQEKGLVGERLCTFKYYVLLSANHKLAQKESIAVSDLSDSIELIHGDTHLQTSSVATVDDEKLKNSSKKIFIYERGSQFNILSELENSYMWASPIPKKTLEKFNLVEKDVTDATPFYTDMLITRKGYQLSEYDQHFIKLLKNRAEFL